MKSINIYLCICFFLLWFGKLANCQQTNPNSYPYGGIPVKSNRYFDPYIRKVFYTLNFDVANFDSVHFNQNSTFFSAHFKSTANFSKSRFDAVANFAQSNFDSIATFENSNFNGSVVFDHSHFLNRTSFYSTQFKQNSYFQYTYFDSLADFRAARFDSSTVFLGAQFNSNSDFLGTKFNSSVHIFQASFDSLADFSQAFFKDKVYFSKTLFKNGAKYKKTTFSGKANFEEAYFGGKVDFNEAYLKNELNFNQATFSNTISFKDAFFDSTALVIFRTAKILDTLIIGSLRPNNIQKYDFSLTQFLPKGTYPIKVREFFGEVKSLRHIGMRATLSKFQLSSQGAKILLCGPVQMKILSEQIALISLADKLDYFTKKFIVEGTKQASFKGSEYKKERFELDYLFAKSTINQEQSTIYNSKPWYKRILNRFYEHTMGLGYRPFKLIYLISGVLIFYFIFFCLTMRNQINKYIFRNSNTKKKTIHWSETIIHIFYFSTMLLFTFRLKKDLLIFFSHREKLIIVSEWCVGFAIKLGFFFGAKEGSILLTLKSLFLG